MLAHVNDGRFVKAEGNPYHPLNRGKLCAKGQSAIQRVYNDQWLKYPLMRTGEKGWGAFKRASWTETLDTIFENIQEMREK